MVALDEFISQAMVSIVSGIQMGQSSDDIGRYIAPLIQGHDRNSVGNFHLKNDKSRQATVVQFDVQVATETKQQKSAEGGAKAKLVVVDVNLGGSGSTARHASNVHRLQFAIPVEIPIRDVADKIPLGLSVPAPQKTAK